MLVVSARAANSRIGSGKTKSRQAKEETDTFEMSKENILNCTPYSLIETHSGRGSTEGAGSRTAHEAKATRPALYPRKRSLSGPRLSGPSSTTRGRELSPPELTTSDNFKPAKRVLGPKPAPDDKRKQSRAKVGIPPSPAAPHSDKLVPRLSIPADSRSVDPRSPSVGVSTNKNCSTLRKSCLTGRRLSVVRLSVSKENAVSLSPKELVKEKVKEPMKKVIVFSAKKTDHQTAPGVQKDVEKVFSKVTEKKPVSAKSPVPFARPSSKAVKPGTVGTDESASKCRNVTRQSGSAKAMAENTRSRKLSMVLQSEQRLQEQNQKLEVLLRELQDELLRKDHEIERLRSTGLILNNMAKNQSDEVRDLKLRLKETFNENSEVRDLCEKLEDERYKERAARKTDKEEEQNNRPLEMQLASLNAHVHNMGVDLTQSGKKSRYFDPTARTSEDQQGAAEQLGGAIQVEESTFQVHSEVQEDVGSKIDAVLSESEVPIAAGSERKLSDATEEVTEDVPVCRHPEVPLKQELSAVCSDEELLAAIRAVQDVHDAEDNEGPVISNHEDVHYALQDLQDIISQEEASLKERCADALKALNMPLSPLLTSQGALDVDSLKVLIVSVSSRGTEFSTHRFNSVFKF